jgi:alpha-amylase
LYQPLGFYVSSNDLGTRAELQDLCTEAEKYGIKVVVDVVANHLAGNHTNIQSDLKSSQYWHTFGSSINYSVRYQVTHGDIGMQDLATENSYVQQVVKNYIADLKSLGVDGIRFDAAKHIGLPSEGDNFWPTVTSDSSMWYYGEILKGPDDSGSNDSLMAEYTKYISVTDGGGSSYSKQVTDSFASGQVPTTIGNWCQRGVSKNKLVYWGESHDTYSNNGEYGEATQNMSQNTIDRAYAIVASQKDATALYFSRPSETKKENIKAGVKGSTHFTSSEVAEVNHMHNACIGESEYYVADTNNNVAAVCRESGACIVLGSGSNRYVTISNGGSTTKPGTYIDHVSGNTWTVTSTTISGKVGDTGIAVLYEDSVEEVTTPSSNISTTGSKNVAYLSLPSGWSETVYCYAYDSETETVNNGTWPGVKMEKDSETGYYKYEIPDNITKPRVIFYSSATNRTPADMEKGYLFEENGSYLYKDGTWSKYTPPATDTSTVTETSSNIAYLSLPSGWSETVYCYAYDSETETVNNGAWPGVKMEKDSETGYYKYEIPDNIEKPRVIFYNSATNRTPANMEKGYLFEENGSYLYKDGTWSKYTPPATDTSTVTETSSNVAYFSLPSGWSETVYCYAYDSATETVNNGAWPGVKMEKDSVTGYYKYVIPDNIEKPRVIFYSSATNRTPANMQKGYLFEAN